MIQALKRHFAPKRARTTEPLQLALFHRMAQDVPAYKRFLQDAHIQPDRVQILDDLAHIPLINKDNYLRINPYHDLFWCGDVGVSHVLTSTSGSTGEPFYFARSHAVDDRSALVHERFFISSSLSKTAPTLVVVCFGMGVWIGGVITYQAFELLGRRGYPLSVITPGINKQEILKILRKLAPHYSQIVLAGYPPFIKDVIDEAVASDIDLSTHRFGIVFAAEAFTEQFRDYIASKVNIADIHADTMNIYGSADLGTMAAETPLSVLVRRLCMKHRDLFTDLFGTISKTPTLAQFDPDQITFEEQGGQLLVSGDSAMPLVRYAIGDSGGVRTFEQISELCKKHGVDLTEEMRVARVSPVEAKKPFVFVYERTDLSTTLYGLQIYPETVREVLLHEVFQPFLTGRLALATRFDGAHDQYLEVNVELREGREATKMLGESLLAEIVTNLELKNGEFHELVKFLGTRAQPRIVFWPHEDPLYFRRDIKQKWVIRPVQA